MTIKIKNSQPLLFPLNDKSDLKDVSRIIVHLAVAAPNLEDSILSLLGKKARFSLVKGSIGYAAEVDVRIINEIPNLAQIREYDEFVPPKLLFIGPNHSHEAMIKAVISGAWAYMSAEDDLSELESAISGVVESTGSSLLQTIASSENASQEFLQELAAPRLEGQVTHTIPNLLTSDEVRILELIARGERSKDIGEIVGLAEQTVKNYVVRILDKTRTQTRAHAAALAAQRGWLPPLDKD